MLGRIRLFTGLAQVKSGRFQAGVKTLSRIQTHVIKHSNDVIYSQDLGVVVILISLAFFGRQEIISMMKENGFRELVSLAPDNVCVFNIQTNQHLLPID